LFTDLEVGIGRAKAAHITNTADAAHIDTVEYPEITPRWDDNVDVI